MEYEMKSGHDYTDKQLGFLEACFQNLNSLDCGDIIFKNMLDEAAQVLSDECCHDLLKINKDCYLGMTQIPLSSYEYRFIASKAFPKVNKHGTIVFIELRTRLATRSLLRNYTN
ncbi:unnamed protein product [Brassica oleracea]